MTTRRTMVECGGLNPTSWQVKYWDPVVECWCDFGDPVVTPDMFAAAVVSKVKRCERGENP